MPPSPCQNSLGYRSRNSACSCGKSGSSSMLTDQLLSSTPLPRRAADSWTRGLSSAPPSRRRPRQPKLPPIDMSRLSASQPYGFNDSARQDGASLTERSDRTSAARERRPLSAARLSPRTPHRAARRTDRPRRPAHPRHRRLRSPPRAPRGERASMCMDRGASPPRWRHGWRRLTRPPIRTPREAYGSSGAGAGVIRGAAIAHTVHVRRDAPDPLTCFHNNYIARGTRSVNRMNLILKILLATVNDTIHGATVLRSASTSIW